MILTWLVLAAVLAQPPAETPADLVKRLGSSRYQEREAASSALLRLGTSALPVLRAAAESGDPEVSGRAQEIAARIENEALAGPSLLRFGGGDRTLDELLAEVRRQGPNRLDWHPETPGPARQRRIHLEAREPLTFWQTVDRICEAGQMRYVPADPISRIHDPQFRLFLTPGADHPYRADDGPFRLELCGLGQFRGVNLVPNDPAPDVRQFASVDPPPLYGARTAGLGLRLRLIVEPRLLIARHGGLFVTEAVDDRGASLLPGEGAKELCCGLGGIIPARAWSTLWPTLQAPAYPVRSIKRLTLTIPVEVVSRRDEPLVIPLADAKGKTFHHGKTTLRILGVTEHDTAFFPLIKFTIRSDERVVGELHGGSPRDLTPGDRPVRPELTESVLQVFDARGRPFGWYGCNAPEAPDGGLNVELKLDGHGGNSVAETGVAGVARPEGGRPPVPATLRYYEYARHVVYPTFTFRDIPIP